RGDRGWQIPQGRAQAPIQRQQPRVERGWQMPRGRANNEPFKQIMRQPYYRSMQQMHDRHTERTQNYNARRSDGWAQRADRDGNRFDKHRDVGPPAFGHAWPNNYGYVRSSEAHEVNAA